MMARTPKGLKIAQLLLYEKGMTTLPFALNIAFNCAQPVLSSIARGFFVHAAPHSAGINPGTFFQPLTSLVPQTSVDTADNTNERSDAFRSTSIGHGHTSTDIDFLPAPLVLSFITNSPPTLFSPLNVHMIYNSTQLNLIFTSFNLSTSSCAPIAAIVHLKDDFEQVYEQKCTIRPQVFGTRTHIKPKIHPRNKIQPTSNTAKSTPKCFDRINSFVIPCTKLSKPGVVTNLLHHIHYYAEHLVKIRLADSKEASLLPW